MIDINELRIKNVLMDDQGNFCTVDGITSGITCNFASGKRNAYYRDLLNSIHPIPLNPEILEKLGFVSGKDKEGNNRLFLRISNTHGRKDLLAYYKSDFIDCCCMFYVNDQHFTGPLITMVHQLQNWFFAHTSQELDTRKLINK